jgi:LmbE family N-acetylglucosaminyl deacetylase
MTIDQTSRAFVTIGLLWACCGAARGAEPNSAPLDLLIVAPHSDDEAIGCTGVILRAIAENKRPGVVVLTAGDGFPKAAAAATKKPIEQLTADDFVALAALRQRHSIEAMRRLGLRADELLFLGYPDGGLAAMDGATTDAAYRHPHTGKSETYGPIVHDYHRTRHGRRAPYLRASVIGDLAEILRARRPPVIYVTGEADTHADHRAAFRLTRDAARAAEFQGEILTFVVHGEPPSTPPDVRLTLSEAEVHTKRTLLESYQVGVSPVHDRLAETYTRPEELFWRAADNR